MIYLILGVLIWSGVHLLPSLGVSKRAAIIESRAWSRDHHMGSADGSRCRLGHSHHFSARHGRRLVS